MTPIKTFLAVSVLALSTTTVAALAASSHASQMGQMQSGFVRQTNPIMSPGTTTPDATTSKPSSPETSSTTPSDQQKGKGQPNDSCGSATAPNTPGNAAAAPGSAFNPDGIAGTKYAGQQSQNSKNPVSVSQYDVACAHQPH
jgi:hypothetical protein